MAGESPPRLRAASACVACNKKKADDAGVARFAVYIRTAASSVRTVLGITGHARMDDSSSFHLPLIDTPALWPRERKRKRRKVASDTKEEPDSTPTDQLCVAPLLPPSRSQREAGYPGWEPRRSIPADGQPSGTSESSGGPGSTAPNNHSHNNNNSNHNNNNLNNNTSQAPATPSAATQDADGCTLYSQNTSGSVPVRPQQQQQQQQQLEPHESASGVSTTFLGRSEYIRGEVPINEDRAKAYPAVATESLMEEDIQILQLQHAFDLPPRAVRDGLIDTFMKRFFLAASRVSSAPAVTAYASSNEFYRRAKALFWSGYEKNTITVITAARDCLISASHGRPRAINTEDNDVRPLTPEDFYGCGADDALFLAHVEVSSLLGDVTQACCRRALTQQKRTCIENALYRWSRELPEHLRLFQRVFPPEGSTASKLVLMPYHFEARQLHVTYFVILAILYRASSPGTIPSAAAILASSFVAGIFEDFLARDEIRFLGPIFTFYLLASGVGLASCYSYPHLWERAQQDLRIICSSLKELSKRWPSAIGSLKALQSMIDETAKAARTAERPQPTPLTTDQQATFCGFGTDLCRLGEVMLAHYPHDIVDTGRQEDDQYARTVSDMMTAGILAELKTPMDPASAPVDEYLPLASVIDHNTQLAFGVEEPTSIIPDEVLYGQYEGIGNWLLRGWGGNTEVPWQ
ncbi:fungal specific transcription factor domain-containing protein [Microsporum canis CBS 113480]|uniref:Fungal specific transcription factor domain-containing protein n=1 Tax=Arthroderma otae (strain ATCC MYA-4605 / CBS 113480) TaxID=554155 RepID=C5FG28_ARTOC|nr:fungal specific transcription factor domain-containing protein [Microsporum canis CBS 113480]EEQ29713.1 fungal specific transcription factor domain-containing protein [Microsporum canis CBS 113480]